MFLSRDRKSDPFVLVIPGHVSLHLQDAVIFSSRERWSAWKNAVVNYSTLPVTFQQLCPEANFYNDVVLCPLPYDCLFPDTMYGHPHDYKLQSFSLTK